MPCTQPPRLNSQCHRRCSKHLQYYAWLTALPFPKTKILNWNGLRFVTSVILNKHLDNLDITYKVKDNSISDLNNLTSHLKRIKFKGYERAEYVPISKYMGEKEKKSISKNKKLLYNFRNIQKIETVKSLIKVIFSIWYILWVQSKYTTTRIRAVFIGQTKQVVHFD